MKLIVGLGNPGTSYQKTRHNVGFLVVDELARRHRIPLSRRRFRALFGTGQIASHPVVLAKPMTYMNRSGEAVRGLLNFFHIEMSGLVVVHDDLDLPFGRIRFKRRGGDGGHQGVRSIIDGLGGNLFSRLKVGIGRPPQDTEPADHVLMPFDEAEQADLGILFPGAAEALEVMLSEGIDRAMNRLQGSLLQSRGAPPLKRR